MIGDSVAEEQAILRQLLSNDTQRTDLHSGEMYRQCLLRIHALGMALAAMDVAGRLCIEIGNDVYKLAYTWAMKANHIGVLEILAELEFFEHERHGLVGWGEDGFLNDRDALELLAIVVRKCNLEALAFTFNRISVPWAMDEETIDYVLSIAAEILSVHRAIGICGTCFGIGNVGMLRGIRAMFLLLKRLGFGDSLPITIDELRPMKHNPDAMAWFLYYAASRNPPRHQDVDTLLRVGIYTQDELEDAIREIQNRANPTDETRNTIGKLRAAMPFVRERGPYSSHVAIARRRLVGHSGPCPSSLR